MNLSRRRWLLRTAALALGGSAPLHASAQAARPAGGDFPHRTIRVIVAFPSGGAADLTARLVTQKMSDALGQPVVIENRPGANGSLGAGVVAKSPADGYTLVVLDRGALGMNPHMYKQPTFDPLKDFAYVGIATLGHYVLVTSSDTPARSWAELVQLAKSKPGALNYASFGVGSMPQINFEGLKAKYGIALTHVPYKGAAPASTAVASHEVDMTLSTAPAVQGFIKEGRMRALFFGGAKRSPILPDVPTVAEVGIGPDVVLPTWFGFAAPTGTPPAIVQKLSAEIRKALAAPDVAERLVNAGLDPLGSTPEEMAKTVQEDVARFGALAKRIGIEPE